MADTIVYMDGTKGPTPIKAVDNGDKTYSLSVTTTNGAGTMVYLPGAMGPTPIKAVLNADGTTYSLLVSGG